MSPGIGDEFQIGMKHIQSTGKGPFAKLRIRVRGKFWYEEKGEHNESVALINGRAKEDTHRYER